MKSFIGIIALVAVLLVSSCATTTVTDTQAGAKITPPAFTVIDHKFMAFGRPAPEWPMLSPMDLEKKDEFKDSYVFIFDQTGASLDAVKAWAQNFVVDSEIAKLVSTRVQAKFTGALAGDKDKVETYMEQVVKSVSEAQFAGLRKVDDYWLLKDFQKDGKSVKQEYAYYFLYAIKKETIDTLIKNTLESIGEAVKPKNEEEVTVRDRVKEAFSNGF